MPPTAPPSAALHVSEPSLAVDSASGDAAAVWTETRGDRSVLRFQRLASGSDQPDEAIDVVSGTVQMHRAVISAASGLRRFLVVWPDVGAVGPAIWARWLDRTGAPLAESLQVSSKTTLADEPRVACTSAGCLAAWWDFRFDPADVFGSWVPPAPPLPSNTPVAVASGSQKITDLAVDPAGAKAWLVWPDSASGKIGIAATGLPPAAAPWTGAMPVATAGTAISYPRIAMDGAWGRGCVAWVQPGPTGPAVMAQLVDGDGAPLGTPATVATAVKTDRPLAVLPLPDRAGFAVLWTTFRYEPKGNGVTPVPDRLMMGPVSPSGGSLGAPVELCPVGGAAAVAVDGRSRAWIVAYGDAAGSRIVRRLPLAPLTGPGI